LSRQQDVLARLRHRSVSRCHYQNRSVHLRCAGDHVFHVVGVTGTVNVRVVTILRLILHVRGRDRDSACFLFRRLVDLIEGDKLYFRIVLRQHLRDRCRQRRLSVVHVPNRPDVHMRL
jgi:hypothetical protein